MGQDISINSQFLGSFMQSNCKMAVALCLTVLSFALAQAAAQDQMRQQAASLRLANIFQLLRVSCLLLAKNCNKTRQEKSKGVL